MIRQIEETVNYVDKKNVIDNMKSFDELDWDSPKNALKVIKEIIKDKLLISQLNQVFLPELFIYDCAYCGSRLDVGGRKEVEHIAYKAKYKQFTYHPTNLVYACSHCNSSSKKGRKDVVSNWDETTNFSFVTNNLYDQIDDIYKDLEFTIVHPKVDNPDSHIEWLDDIKTVVKCGITTKGKTTVSMFKLDSMEMTLQRKREYREEQDFLLNRAAFVEALKYTTKY